MLLLERETQVSRLAKMLAHAREGQGGLVVLSGEAGAGKTSVVRHFLQSVPDVRVLRSFCEDLSVPDPLGPLYDLAREAQLTLPRDPDRSQLSLFSAVLEMLNRRSEPTIAVIEDVHWADDATLDFIRFLGRRIDGTHLLVILTARTEGTSGQKRMRRALVDVPNHSLVRLDVPLLSLAAVTELALTAGLDSEVVYEATAGNAFFVAELVASSASDTLPESVAAAVLERADKLSINARAALDLVSLFPRRAETDLLLPILGTSAGLGEAIESGLLEQSTNTVAFRHEIARRAVELTLPEAQRQLLSGRILEALQQVPDVPVARLVHHARAAGDPQVIAPLRQQREHGLAK